MSSISDHMRLRRICREAGLTLEEAVEAAEMNAEEGVAGTAARVAEVAAGAIAGDRERLEGFAALFEGLDHVRDVREIVASKEARVTAKESHLLTRKLEIAETLVEHKVAKKTFEEMTAALAKGKEALRDPAFRRHAKEMSEVRAWSAGISHDVASKSREHYHGTPQYHHR